MNTATWLSILRSRQMNSAKNSLVTNSDINLIGRRLLLISAVSKKSFALLILLT
jgi:hypothetical protein